MPTTGKPVRVSISSASLAGAPPGLLRDWPSGRYTLSGQCVAPLKSLTRDAPVRGDRRTSRRAVLIAARPDVRSDRRRALAAQRLHGAERVAQLREPLLRVLADQPHAPGER